MLLQEKQKNFRLLDIFGFCIDRKKRFFYKNCSKCGMMVKNEQEDMTMEFEKLIEERRSIRKYDSSRRATKEQITAMVQAAIQAPSWKNSQTARYYAILEEAKCEEFSESCLPQFNRDSSKGASYLVTTFVKNRAGYNRETGAPDNECGNGWGYYDLGLQNENLILKAKELGLDTLIMGIRDAEKIHEMLQIPETEQVVAVIAVGYRDIDPEKPKRKTPEAILTFVEG